MLDNLLQAGLIASIARGIHDKLQVKRAKQHADEYFRRTNAEREAIEKRLNERINKILERYKREDEELAARQAAEHHHEKFSKEYSDHSSKEKESNTIRIEGITIQSTNVNNPEAFDKIFQEMERLFNNQENS